MRVAIIGDGKMGRAIAALATDRGDEVTAIVGLEQNRRGEGISRERLDRPDVVLEFTEPASAVGNILGCVRAGLPVVTGTTGWYRQLVTVTTEVQRAGGAMLWAPNFSVGVAILTVAAEVTAEAVRRSGGFDAHVVETHHAAKKDRPSGTAASLAERVAEGLGREIPITSVRTGHVPGTHEILFDAPFEQVRLVHEARDRRVFADGALVAARWLQGRTGVYTMRDVIQLREEG